MPLGTTAPTPTPGHLQNILSVTKHGAIPRRLQINISLLPLSQFQGLGLGGCLL